MSTDPSADPAIQNLPLGSRARGGSIDAQLDRYMAAQRREARREQRAQAVRRRAQREAERKRVRLTAADLQGARVVRTDTGWHVVLKVNAKSVTVPSVVGGSWTDRLALDKVLEVRR